MKSNLILALAAVVGAALGTTANAGPHRATPWAVIKRKFSDQAQEPALAPAFITGNEGLAGYWREVVYANIVLDGSAIFGWYTLPISLAQGRAFPVNTIRTQLIDACRAAATNVVFSQFYGVIALLNAQIDSGADGTGNGRVLLDPYHRP